MVGWLINGDGKWEGAVGSMVWRGQIKAKILPITKMEDTR